MLRSVSERVDRGRGDRGDRADVRARPVDGLVEPDLGEDAFGQGPVHRGDDAGPGAEHRNGCGGVTRNVSASTRSEQCRTAREARAVRARGRASAARGAGRGGAAGLLPGRAAPRSRPDERPAHGEQERVPAGQELGRLRRLLGDQQVSGRTNHGKLARPVSAISSRSVSRPAGIWPRSRAASRRAISRRYRGCRSGPEAMSAAPASGSSDSSFQAISRTQPGWSPSTLRKSGSTSASPSGTSKRPAMSVSSRSWRRCTLSPTTASKSAALLSKCW